MSATEITHNGGGNPFQQILAAQRNARRPRAPRVNPEATLAHRRHAEHVGQRIRACRKAQALSQEQLADRAGTTARHLSMIERGCRMPGALTVERIADALGVHWTRLYADTEPAPAPPPEVVVKWRTIHHVASTTIVFIPAGAPLADVTLAEPLTRNAQRSLRDEPAASPSRLLSSTSDEIDQATDHSSTGPR